MAVTPDTDPDAGAQDRAATPEEGLSPGADDMDQPQVGTREDPADGVHIEVVHKAL